TLRDPYPNCPSTALLRIPSRFLFLRRLARFTSSAGPGRRTGPRQWIAILSGEGVSIRLDQILAGARRCLCMTRTLFAGSRQLLQLSLFVDNEPANHDCCELVPEHLRLRPESLDFGFLAGVELLADHEGHVLFDDAERLVGGGEADIRRLWRSVAVGGGSGGFGHRFPYKTSFCDLPEDYRRWLGWPGRPNCGRATRVRSSPSDPASRFPVRPSAWQRWLRCPGSCRGGNRRTGRRVACQMDSSPSLRCARWRPRARPDDHRCTAGSRRSP